MPVCEVSIDQEITGSTRPVVNVFHVNKDENTFISAVAQNIADSWVEFMLLSQVSAVKLKRVRVRGMNGLDYAEVTANASGANASAGTPPQVALLGRKVTPGLPRKRYGRIFLVGIGDADIDDGGNISTTILNAVNTRFTGFLTDLAAGNHPMVQPFWQTTVNGRTFSDFYPVASLVAQSKVATQRRRVRG